jgi:hypothetical protein
MAPVVAPEMEATCPADVPEGDPEDPLPDATTAGVTQVDAPRLPVLVPPTPEELSRERLLLGEAHHRVKNHLQIITSMLNLQASTLHNEEALRKSSSGAGVKIKWSTLAACPQRKASSPWCERGCSGVKMRPG